MLRFDFTGQTVLIAGAGCAAGTALAALFAEASNRVIAIDWDEDAVVAIAAQAPSRIEPLRLDVAREDHCQHLGRIWADEPIGALLHLQPLRTPGRAGRTLTSIVTLSRALQPGLEAGVGGVVYLFQTPQADAASDAVGAAYRRLAPAMQDAFGENVVTVNGVQLPQDGQDALWSRVFDIVVAMTGPQGLGIGGAILPLVPRSH